MQRYHVRPIVTHMPESFISRGIRVVKERCFFISWKIDIIWKVLSDIKYGILLENDVSGVILKWPAKLLLKSIL